MSTPHHLIRSGPLAAVLLAALTLSATGEPLAPGQTIFGLSGKPMPAGTVVEDEFYYYDAGWPGNHYQWTVQARVVRLDASGTYAFQARITDYAYEASAGTWELGGLVLPAYDGWQCTDVAWLTSTPGDVVPSQVVRFDGGGVQFGFDGNPLAEGQISRWLSIETDAPAYARGEYPISVPLLKDGNLAVVGVFSENAFVPTPEPTTLGLLALGGTVVLLRRRLTRRAGARRS